MSANLDTEVRLELYREFVGNGRAPKASQLAEKMRLQIEEVRAALERLASAKAIVLQPESREILIAAPLCAAPTPFVAHAGERSYFGTCVWDGLGIIAMLKTDGTLETSCPCCGETLEIEIRGGKPIAERGIVHFGIPARRWWENIVFT